MNDTTLLSNNPLRLGRTYCKMTISEKINTTVGKIEKNKAQYSLDKTNCLDLSSGNVRKYVLLTGKDVIPE